MSGTRRTFAGSNVTHFVRSWPLSPWHDAGMDDVDREAPASTEPGISYAIARLHQRFLGSVSQLAARHGLTALQFTTLAF